MSQSAKRSALEPKDKLVSEVVQDVVLSGEASTRPAVEQFVTTVRPLRWSNRALDHIASLSAEAQLRMFAVMSTDLCADAAYWKAHDHELSPADTAQVAQQSNGETTVAAHPRHGIQRTDKFTIGHWLQQEEEK
jgi:hypothetical protein